MSIANAIAGRRRAIGIGCVGLVAVAMWHAASSQFTSGVLDLAVFAPPGIVLGIAATWSAHVFVPNRFTWRRGLVGAVVSAMVISPIIAFLVAFTAAWDQGSFQIVFILGAWLAIVAGLCAAVAGRVIAWTRAWRRARVRSRSLARQESELPMPDANDGFRPTTAGKAEQYPEAMTVPR